MQILFNFSAVRPIKNSEANYDTAPGGMKQLIASCLRTCYS